MKITYLDHSGFAVEYKKYVLIFDWYKVKFLNLIRKKEILCIFQPFTLRSF